MPGGVRMRYWMPCVAGLSQKRELGPGAFVPTSDRTSSRPLRAVIICGLTPAGPGTLIVSRVPSRARRTMDRTSGKLSACRYTVPRVLYGLAPRHQASNVVADHQRSGAHWLTNLIRRVTVPLLLIWSMPVLIAGPAVTN